MAKNIAKRFFPLLDRVLVRRFKPEAKTKTGILLPDTAQTKLNRGTVVATGPGLRTRDGDVLPLACKVGDEVILSEYGGAPLKLDGEEFHLYRDEDVLGIWKGD